MRKIVEEVVFDLNYIKNHALQPKWFKVAKIFILLAGVGGYAYAFGWARTLVFVLVFMLLSTVVHFTYRIQTERFTKSWLDFRVREENGNLVTERIGKYYYCAILLNALIAFAVSQLISI